MKQRISYLLMGLLITCMLCIGNTKVSAEEFQTIEVNEVDDIQNASGGSKGFVQTIEKREEKDFGTQTNYYSFTLEQPSYVKITDYADVFVMNFAGDISVSLSTGQIFQKAHFKNKFADGREYTYYTLLDEGTYYIKVDVAYTSLVQSKKSSYKDNPTNTICIYAEPLEGRENGVGTSKKKAIKLKTGNESYSQLSEFSRSKYYSIDITRTTDIIFQCNFITKEGWDKKYITKDNGVLWTVYNEKGEKLAKCQTNCGSAWGDEETENNFVNFHLKALKPGKYYVVASCDIELKDGEGLFETQCTPIVLYAPGIESVKRSGTSAKVVLKKKISQVSGYQIAYATKKDMSDAKYVTLDKNTKLSRTIKGLKKDKKYYVQARSYYKTADGETYYGGFWKKVVVK